MSVYEPIGYPQVDTSGGGERVTDLLRSGTSATSLGGGASRAVVYERAGLASLSGEGGASRAVVYQRTGAASLSGSGSLARQATFEERGAVAVEGSGGAADEATLERSGFTNTTPFATAGDATTYGETGLAHIQSWSSGGDFTGRLLINPSDITRSGTGQPAITPSDAIHKNRIVGNDGQIYIEISTIDAAPQTVSVLANPTLLYDGLSLNPLVIDVPVGSTILHGPFSPNTFNQDTIDNEMWLDPSVSATIRFRAYRLDTPY